MAASTRLRYFVGNCWKNLTLILGRPRPPPTPSEWVGVSPSPLLPLGFKQKPTLDTPRPSPADPRLPLQPPRPATATAWVNFVGTQFGGGRVWAEQRSVRGLAASYPPLRSGHFRGGGKIGIVEIWIETYNSRRYDCSHFRAASERFEMGQPNPHPMSWP